MRNVKTSRKLATLVAAVALMFALGPAGTACLCGAGEDAACAASKAGHSAGLSPASACCAAEHSEPAGSGPMESAGAVMHRCVCASPGPQSGTAVLAAATAHSTPKPYDSLLSTDAPPAPHPRHTQKDFAGAAAVLQAAANPPPSFLIACALLI